MQLAKANSAPAGTLDLAASTAPTAATAAVDLADAAARRRRQALQALGNPSMSKITRDGREVETIVRENGQGPVTVDLQQLQIDPESVWAVDPNTGQPTMASWNRGFHNVFHQLHRAQLIKPHLILSFSSGNKVAQYSRQDLPEGLPSACQLLQTASLLQRLATAMGVDRPLAKGYIGYCPCHVEFAPVPGPPLPL
jgi:hypothetical protein